MLPCRLIACLLQHARATECLPFGEATPSAAALPAWRQPAPTLPPLTRRSRVTLVCKRWERLFYSEPALWRHFLLRPATPGFPGAVGNSSQQELEEIWAHWCAAKHRQLARVAGLVEVFEAGPRRVDLGRMAGTGSRLDHFVSLLRPEVLTEALLYWGLPEMSELPRFPRLSRLLLHALVLNPGAARLLGGMPQLRSLGLHVHEVSGSNMSVILGLTQLTQLSFVVFNALTAGFNYQPSRDSEPRAPDLLQLTRLAALRHLTITHRPSLYQQEREEYEFGRQGVLPLPPPASFPALEFYHVSFRQDEWYSWAFSVSGYGCVRLRDGCSGGGGGGCRQLGAVAASRVWRLCHRCCVTGCPLCPADSLLGKTALDMPLQVGGAQLAGCQYAAGASGSIGRLEIVSARHVPSMPHLLAALVPPGKPLTTLELKNSQLWVGGRASGRVGGWAGTLPGTKCRHLGWRLHPAGGRQLLERASAGDGAVRSGLSLMLCCPVVPP